MWVLVALFTVVGLLVLHGIVTDFRMRRIRRRVPSMTDPDQRAAEVVGSLGPLARRRNLRRVFAARIIADLLNFLDRG